MIKTLKTKYMSAAHKEYNNFVIGLYDHETTLLSAIKKIRSSGVQIYDALTPVPVHGIDPALGLKDTRLHTAGFFFGMTGTTIALSVITFISKFNYPIIVGGKPFWALPSYIPITFELTVLCAAVGMVTTYCVRNKLFPGRVPRIFDKSTTDDRFGLTFAVDDLSAGDIEKIKSLLKETGAVDVKDKVFTDQNATSLN
jgi:hypothetical protein